MPTLLVSKNAVAGTTGVGLKVVDVVGVVGVVIDEVGVVGVLAGVVIDVVGEVVVAVVDAAGTSVDTEALLASAAALLVVLPPPHATRVKPNINATAARDSSRTKISSNGARSAATRCSLGRARPDTGAPPLQVTAVM